MNPNIVSSRRFSRQLILMAVLGTLVPLVMLALLYALAPMPLSASAVASLRTANSVAGVLVGINALAVVVMWGVSRMLRKTVSAQGAWQPVEVSRRVTA